MQTTTLNKTVSLESSGAYMLRRAGMLAVFLLAFCLLGIDNARAEGSTQIHLVRFVPHRTIVETAYGSGVIHEYTFNTPFAISSSFDFNNVRYTVNKVVSRGSQVDLEISPKFPPDGTDRSEFYLHLGLSGSGGTLTENVKFNFGNSTSGTRSTWNGSAGWENKVQTAYLRITGPANTPLRFGALPQPGANHGRLEIFDADAGEEGQWKWVCDDNFGAEEARVACRQMGLPTSGAAVWEMPEGWLDYESTYYENLEGFTLGLVALYLTELAGIPALLDDVDCDGDESYLTACDHAGRGVSDCSVSEAVGVTCP